MTIPTILLIDDEAVIRLSTAAMLEDAGYGVLEAADGSEALALLSSHPEISVVLTDVQMPGAIDGLDLVEIVQQDYPAIKSIVASGRSGLREARQSGAGGFLAKPYTAAAMHEALKKVLAA